MGYAGTGSRSRAYTLPVPSVFARIGLSLATVLCIKGTMQPDVSYMYKHPCCSASEESLVVALDTFPLAWLDVLFREKVSSPFYTEYHFEQ